MKKDILRLRQEGKSYKAIKNELGCSLGSISYHCGEGQKIKSRDRLRKSRKNTSIIIKRKLDKFVKTKIHNFKRAKTYLLTNSRTSYDAAYKKIYDNPICYLTGRKIDLDKPQTYNLDHMVAFSKGGSNDLTNMGLACKEANAGKSNLSVTDFIQLCVDVCNHNGYQVIKK